MIAARKLAVAAVALAAAWMINRSVVARQAPPRRPSSQPAQPADARRWEPAIVAFEAYDRRNSPPKDALLFVGSSSIVNWPTATSFPNRTVLNRGFGGSQISELNEFVGRIVAPYRPSAIVLYSGDNDANEGKSAERIADDFKEFVRLVRRQLPTTPIYCLSIKPSRSRWALWPTMRRANELIQNVCEAGDRLHFVDVATPLLGDDGEPRVELYLEDQLHLKPAAYEMWTRILDRALGETAPR